MNKDTNYFESIMSFYEVIDISISMEILSRIISHFQKIIKKDIGIIETAMNFFSSGLINIKKDKMK